MREVNPFEPWRPKSDGANPAPQADILRPWQPDESSSNEPSPSAPLRPLVPREVPVPPPAPRPALPGISLSRRVLIVVTCLLVLGMGIRLHNDSMHFLRILLACLAVWVGFAVLLGPARLRWFYRVPGLLGGCVLGVLFWYLVPTDIGVSRADARQTLRKLAAVEPGDFEAFAEAREEARVAARAFPGQTDEQEWIERNWAASSIELEIADVDSQRDAAPQEALARLRRTTQALRDCQVPWTSLTALNECRHRAITAYLDREEKTIRGLASKGQFNECHEHIDRTTEEVRSDAAACNADLPGWAEREHQTAVRRQSQAAVAVLQKFLTAQRLAEIVPEARRLEAALLPHAKYAGKDVDVLAPIREVRRQALAARLDQARGQAQVSLARGDWARVLQETDAAEKALTEEAELVFLREYLRDSFVPLRQRVVLGRIEQAREELRELLSRKEFVRVAEQGRDLQATLEEQASAAGLAGEARQVLWWLRRTALRSRLDLARTAALDHLKQDRYQEMNTVGAQALAELSDEANDVGESEMLHRFANLCRHFARLGKLAKQE